MYVCIHADMHKCVYMCVSMYADIYACIYEFIHLCSQTYKSLHVYICMQVYHVSIPMSLYTCGMTLKKYGCHIANMTHIDVMLLGNRYPTLFLICAKTPPIAISISNNIAIMSEEQIYPSNATYANDFMYRYDTAMSVQTPHMSSLQSTV